MRALKVKEKIDNYVDNCEIVSEIKKEFKNTYNENDKYMICFTDLFIKLLGIFILLDVIVYYF